MSFFDRRPWLRWTIPVGAAATLVAGAVLGPVGAVADSPLPERSAEDLLVALQQTGPTPLSGTLSVTTDWGLPELPMGVLPSSGPLALMDGTSTVRVWTDGSGRARLALIEPSAETTVVRTGSEVWVWSSAEATADRFELPDLGRFDPPSTTDWELPERYQVPGTPQEAAQWALAAIDPTTAVSTSGTASVAGRDVYQLILDPKDDQTLVERIVLSMDAANDVVLRLQVLSTVVTDPALDLGFTSVDYGVPDAALFEFTPPPGATVTEHELPELTGPELAEAELTDAELAKLTESTHGREPGGGAHDGLPQPVVAGSGWSTVLVADLPPGGLADLVAMGGADAPEQSPWRGSDPATIALMLLEALPESSGPWGTGRVFAGTLFSVIVTDDGRIAVGSVDAETLAAALADTR